MGKNAVPPDDAPVAVAGPSDKVLRLLAGGIFVGGVVLLGANHAKSMMDGEVYPVALVLGPLASMLGLAGLISPNLLRSAGKHGKHLPLRYKLIAAAFGVVGLLTSLLLIFFVYSVGR